MKLTISIIFLLSVVSKSYEECVSRDYGFGSTVCVCNSEQCDTIAKPEELEESQYYIYTSNKAGLRFNQETGNFDSIERVDSNQIRINAEQKYQTIFGFGGAFTDATGININSLEEDVQGKLLKSYFSEDGLEYSLCRVPIAGTDFSLRAYSYDDGDADSELTNFALAEEDHFYKIPYIKKALDLTSNNLQLFASAWTAPKWMKTNGEFDGLGFLKEEYYQTWADYFVKFLDSYKDEGIEFWGITTGNEPHTAFLLNGINAVGWTAPTMGDWILNNLGPTIRNSSHSDISLMVLDDNTVFLPWFADLALADNTSGDYIDGIASHWYIDSVIPAGELLTETHQHFPEKFILYTEASHGAVDDSFPTALGRWEDGEEYSSDIIEVLQNWVTGWVDWNMALDLDGGPTYINNFLLSPIIVNATANEFYKQPMYYHLGHFSKFVSKNSVRIESSSDLDENVRVVAFQRPDNGIAVVILNLGEAVTVSLVDDTKGIAQVKLSDKSITTVLYW